MKMRERLEVAEVMASNAYYTWDKVTSTTHQRVYVDLDVGVFNIHPHTMCNNILYSVTRYFFSKKSF